MEKLTEESITRRQIRALGIEAFEHGDLTMFDITVAALDGEISNPHVAAARRTCADKLNAEAAREAHEAAECVAEERRERRGEDDGLDEYGLRPARAVRR